MHQQNHAYILKVHMKYEINQETNRYYSSWYDVEEIT